MKKPKFQDYQFEAMLAVKNGADVFSYGIAKALREVEQSDPELIDICKAMGNYGDGSNREPYFGAILTPKGQAALREFTHAAADRD